MVAKIHNSTRLAIKGAGLIAGNIEFNILLIDAFVPIDTVLFRVIPHDVVPPVEERERFRLVDRIAEIASRVLLDHPSGDVIDLAIAIQGIQQEKQSSLVVVELVDAGTHIRFDRKPFL